MSLKHWMPLFIGDYTGDTQHLSLTEDGAYLRLLMHYWATGRPVTLEMDKVYRITKAFTELEKNAVLSVLEQFFNRTDDGFTNNRIEKLLADQESRRERNSDNGRKGGRPKTKPIINPEHNPNETQNITENITQKKGNPQPHPQPYTDPKPSPKSDTHLACARDADCEKFAQAGNTYAIGSGNVNMQNYAWVDGYLSNQYIEIRNSKPNIPAEAVLKVWQQCCDDASAKAVSHPKWYRTTFENRIDEWKPGTTSAGIRPAGRAPESEIVQIKAWRKGERFRYLGTGEIFEANQLEAVNYGSKRPAGKLDAFLLPDGGAYVVSEFQIMK